MSEATDDVRIQETGMPAADGIREIDLSVVIPCLDAADSVARAIRLLAAQHWDRPWEIVVADNGSSDGTRQVVEELQREIPGLRLVDASARRGAAFARNSGARAAEGRSIAFFDADDIPHEGWVAAMGNALAEHTFVACRLDSDTLNEDWAIAVRGRPQDSGLLPTSFHPFLPVASGGTIGIRRSLFLELGGFDESLHIAGEDLELCWRVQLAGHPLVFVPEATVSMRYRHSFRAVFEQARRYAYGQPMVYERYRDAVVPPGLHASSPTAASEHGATTWRDLLRDVTTRGGRARWVWRLGWYTGIAQGAIRRTRTRAGAGRDAVLSG